MEHLIILGVVWMLLGRWFWWGSRFRGQRRSVRRMSGRVHERLHRGGSGLQRGGCGSRYAERRLARAEGAAGTGGTGDGRKMESAPPVAAGEDPVARLQREWIGGAITDEEYEKGLDALFARQR